MARDRYQPRQRDIIRNESRKSRKSQTVNRHGQRQLTQYARDQVARQRSRASERDTPDLDATRMLSVVGDNVATDRRVHESIPNVSTLSGQMYTITGPVSIGSSGLIYRDEGFWRRFQRMQSEQSGYLRALAENDVTGTVGEHTVNNVVTVGDSGQGVRDYASLFTHPIVTATTVQVAGRVRRFALSDLPYIGQTDLSDEDLSDEEAHEPSYQPFARRALTRADEHTISLVEGLVCSVCAEEMIVHVDTGCHLAPRRMCHECMVMFVTTQLKSAPCALCPCGARLTGLELILTDEQVSSIPHHVTPQLDGDLLAAMAALGAQRCGQCGNAVEKTGGCNHIVCICKCEFCYLCGATWRGCECPMFSK